jgi:hypothetical protein
LVARAAVPNAIVVHTTAVPAHTTQSYSRFERRPPSLGNLHPQYCAKAYWERLIVKLITRRFFRIPIERGASCLSTAFFSG